MRDVEDIYVHVQYPLHRKGSDGMTMREIRQARALSQAALAAASGVSRGTVALIEAGRLNPTVTVARRLAAALDVTLDDLFGDGDMQAVVEASLAPGSRAIRRADGGLLDAETAPTMTLVTPFTGRVGRDGTYIGGPFPLPPEVPVVAGCDPVLGLLAAIASSRGHGVVWLSRNNSAALAALRSGLVDAAVLHLPSADRPPSDLLATPFLIEAVGWMSRPGDPPRADLDAIRSGRVRLSIREEGSGAARMLKEVAGGAALPGRVVASPLDQAASVRLGGADLSLGSGGAAALQHLAFQDVASETLWFVFRAGRASRLPQLLDLISGDRLPTAASEIGPYAKPKEVVA